MVSVIHAKYAKAQMGRNEEDIVGLKKDVGYIKTNITDIVDRLKELRTYYEDIMRTLDRKADKEDLDDKVSLDRFRPVEKNVSIAIGLIVSTVLVAAIGFLLKAGLGL